MKKLFLMRHAKSSWEYSEIADHDRPLTEKGILDAYKVANYLVSHQIKPDLIISSSAVRTISTAKIIIEITNCDFNILKIEPKIYESNAKSIFSVIRRINLNVNVLMVIGHEPSLNEFCTQLLKIDFLKIPTSGLVSIETKSSNWKYVNTESSKFSQLIKASDLK